MKPKYQGSRETGLQSFPASVIWGVGLVSNETAETLDTRCTVWRRYPCPDATVGVLSTVPFKGYGYSPTCKCTRCSLMDSHPVRHKSHLRQGQLPVGAGGICREEVVRIGCTLWKSLRRSQKTSSPSIYPRYSRSGLRGGVRRSEMGPTRNTAAQSRTL